MKPGTTLNKNDFENLNLKDLWKFSFQKDEINTDLEKLKNAIDTTNFKSLQSIENAGKFGENVYSLKDNRKIKFFYQGPENDWKKNLDESMIKKMNDYYKNDLKFFRYES